VKRNSNNKPKPLKENFHPEEALGSPVDELQELMLCMSTDLEAHQAEFERIIQNAAGKQLASVDELRAFKRVFKSICQQLGLKPLLPNRERGSLQIKGESNGRAWTGFCGPTSDIGTGAPANTIPDIHLG